MEVDNNVEDKHSTLWKLMSNIGWLTGELAVTSICLRDSADKVCLQDLNKETMKRIHMLIHMLLGISQELKSTYDILKMEEGVDPVGEMSQSFQEYEEIMKKESDSEYKMSMEVSDP